MHSTSGVHLKIGVGGMLGDVHGVVCVWQIL